MPFRKHFLQSFSRKQVSVTWNPKTRPLPEPLISEMEAFWKNKVLTSPGGEYFFDGALCRLDSWEAEANRLYLHFGSTNYKELLYSNHRVESGEDVPFGELSYALGISAVLVSADTQIVLIRRSRSVGEAPGMLDILGGHIHPDEHAANGAPDAFLAMLAEIEEEAGVVPADLEMACIGLLETVHTRKPELIFTAHSTLPAKEIMASARRKNSFEVAEIITVAQEALSLFLETRGKEFSPSAYGGLWLYAEFLAME